jgi:hypothetical protein
MTRIQKSQAWSELPLSIPIRPAGYKMTADERNCQSGLQGYARSSRGENLIERWGVKSSNFSTLSSLYITRVTAIWTCLRSTGRSSDRGSSRMP